MKLNRESPKPLYMQLEEILVNRIESKQLQPHQQIPSENELSKEYGLSRMTVRGVLNNLTQNGILYRVPGKGTFVARPKIISKPISQMGIREQLEEMGYETSTSVLTKEIIPAPTKIAKELQIAYQTEVYVLERIRYANGEPLSLHTSYLPVSLCPDLFSYEEIEKIPLCHVLEKNYNLKVGRGQETLESVSANYNETGLLKIRKGYPLLLLRYVMYSKREQIPFEYAKVLFRGDKIKLKFEFDRD
ncbi:MAG: GntR family transcriptional regulator [Bacillota bacterium]